MGDLVRNLFDRLYSIRQTLSGDHAITSPLLAEVKKELADKRIPTTEDDRNNLKQDFSNVTSDYRKAVNDKLSACL